MSRKYAFIGLFLLFLIVVCFANIRSNGDDNAVSSEPTSTTVASTLSTSTTIQVAKEGLPTDKKTKIRAEKKVMKTAHKRTKKVKPLSVKKEAEVGKKTEIKAEEVKTASVEKEKSENPSYTAVVSTDRLIVRAGPGVAFEAMSVLKKGEEVTVYEEKIGWLRIQPPERVRFYVAKEYVRKLEEGDDGVVITNSLNIRAKPSVESTPVAQLNEGNTVKITGEVNGFYEILPPKNTFCWVKKEFVKYLSESDVGKKGEVEKKQDKKVLTTLKWLDLYLEVAGKIIEENGKEPAESRNYLQFIPALSDLMVRAPTDDLKELTANKIAKLKERQNLVETLKIKTKHSTEVNDESSSGAQYKQSAFVISGLLESADPAAEHPTSYVLKNEKGEIIYYVAASSDNVKLEPFSGRKVAISGELKKLKNKDVLFVEEIRLKY